MQHNDKEQVQDHVDHTGQQQEIQRPLGIPYSAQYGGPEVIQHGRGHSQKEDAHIKRSLREHFLRGSHQRQQGIRQADADNQQNYAKNQACKHRGMYGLLQILSVSRSVILGGQNIGAYREPDKEVDNEIDQCAGGTHRRQSTTACETAYHYDIRRIEQQL